MVARADLLLLHDAAHAQGGTVNDAVLAATTGALHTLLRARGEDVDHLVVSVPVSARTSASATQLGNQVGVIPVSLPVVADAHARVATIATATRERKQPERGASSVLLGPAFRVLARLGLLKPMIDRQRLINTGVTNLRGPDSRLSLLGCTIDDVLAISTVAGNVTVSFAVLSYAGTLNVTVIADPEQCPDLPSLAEAVQHELDALTQPVRPGANAMATT